jgi:ribose 5-phosphate isomerase B
MRVAIASDHGGFLLKQHVLASVRALGHEPVDLGTFGPEPADYPDQAELVGQEVLSGRAERGLLLCGSGVGAVVAVNKLPGIRAGLCHDTYSAHQGVEHDDMNVLVLGGLVVGPALAHELVKAYMGARYAGAERHRRRLDKVSALEARYGRPRPPGKVIT